MNNLLSRASVRRLISLGDLEGFDRRALPIPYDGVWIEIDAVFDRLFVSNLIEDWTEKEPNSEGDEKWFYNHILQWPQRWDVSAKIIGFYFFEQETGGDPIAFMSLGYEENLIPGDIFLFSRGRFEFRYFS